MSNDFNTDMKHRIIIVQILIVASIFFLGAKSFDIQIFKAKELTRKAEDDYSRHFTIHGERGQILDRSMNKLATSIDAVSITACPLKIKNPKDAAEKISNILDINQKELQNTLSSKRTFAWVAKKISPDQAGQIRQLNLTGIYFETDSKRFYPNRTLAAQVIGFTGAEDSGLEGLEFKYDSVMKGSSARINMKRDGNGGNLDLDKKKRVELRGNSIVLTIDKKIQFLSEKTLEKTVMAHRAKSGIALVMRPQTGELLSIAHFPKFNPNNFKEHDRSVFRNRAVTDAFEPGSVMKVFTAAAALEKGFEPQSIFFCENGNYKIGTFTIHDTHPHDWLSINQIIKFSSNIGAAKIVQTIGKRSLHNHLVAFGFGDKTMVGCPGETSGNLSPYRKWSNIDAGAISFGQGVSVSAIQLISGISAIANDGNLMKPMLIKKIISNTGKDIKVYHPERIRQVVSSKIAGQVKRMMSLAVKEEGTGTKAAMNGYSVCGKTGTAQKAMEKRKGYSKRNYISVFGGFAPQGNPELAILVVVDEPRKQYYGGDVAAPAFKSIMAESFNYLNIPPEKSKNMIALLSSGEKT
ncbi:peptidoglycan D,D-transpeptidase FtsI family protein [Desulfobacula toluolica]|uniref:PenA: penicillin-binding protein 2 n=1 Tax=Desulfobacula toluolica (strain DSM 7467 / Tol2) TaxID=651182 RepID=K0NHR4_DESTT|nr:penicillin-binding protein 2 [Desulfobacula toluolica]CCK79378.1 PenA: penicillin-binding protein 2 [Desulfobacula toluolica Tol2]